MEEQEVQAQKSAGTNIIREFKDSEFFLSTKISLCLLIFLLLISLILSEIKKIEISNTTPVSTSVINIINPSFYDYNNKDGYFQVDCKDECGNTIKKFQYDNNDIFVKTNRSFDSYDYIKEIPIKLSGNMESGLISVSVPTGKQEVYEEQYLLNIIKARENKQNFWLGNIFDYIGFIQILIGTCIGNIIINILSFLSKSVKPKMCKTLKERM